MSSRGLHSESARSQIVICEDDGKLEATDEANPFSFVQFVKSKNRSTPVKEEKKHKASKKEPHGSTVVRDASLPLMKRHPDPEFHMPFFCNTTVGDLLNGEEEDSDSDDWNGIYQPSAVEHALNITTGCIPITRNNFDSFSITSADLSWQVNDGTGISCSLPAVSSGTNDCSSSLPDMSQLSIDLSSSLPDGTAEYSPLLPEDSQGCVDSFSPSPDVPYDNGNLCLPLPIVHLRTPDQDLVAHGDFSEDICMQSMQRICEELKDENSQLLMKVEEMQQKHQAQAEKIQVLEKKLKAKQIEEAKEAKALESMAQQVEQNLKTMTMRAVRAENKVVKLEEDMTLLQSQLGTYKVENASLRHMENVNLHAARNNAQLALANLHKVIYDSQSSLQQLLSGGETLRFVTELLKSIDRITELQQESHP